VGAVRRIRGRTRPTFLGDTWWYLLAPLPIAAVAMAGFYSAVTGSWMRGIVSGVGFAVAMGVLFAVSALLVRLFRPDRVEFARAFGERLRQEAANHRVSRRRDFSRLLRLWRAESEDRPVNARAFIDRHWNDG
jgi:hypothetical protein